MYDCVYGGENGFYSLGDDVAKCVFFTNLTIPVLPGCMLRTHMVEYAAAMCYCALSVVIRLFYYLTLFVSARYFSIFDYLIIFLHI